MAGVQWGGVTVHVQAAGQGYACAAMLLQKNMHASKQVW